MDEIDEYELMYGDEMDMANEPEFLAEPLPGPSSSTQSRPIATPGPSTSRRDHPQDSEELFLNSPALSQIPHNSSINRRRLFGAASTPVAPRGVSTPFNRTAFDPTNLQDALLFDSMEGGPVPLDSNQQRKRRLGALFEDIFIPDETDHVQKKLKNEVEKDENLIRLILDARSKAHNRLDSKKGNELQKIQELNEFKRRNLCGSVPKWPFTVVTRTDGDRVYVRTHSEEFEKKELEEISLKKSPHESILGDQRAAIWEGAREYMHKRLTAGGQQGEDATEEVAVQQIIPVCTDTTLWVDKYRPKKYVDLISDEATNRTILKWLKMWDKIVFNRQPKDTAIVTGSAYSDSSQFSSNHSNNNNKPLNTFNKATGKFESTGGWQSKRKRFVGNFNANRDELGRPVQKVILIAGSPGLGKTTLAHVIAKQAGYNVREMNASDDRSVEAFRQALESGTQMKSVLGGAQKKPNCIILDEIDGAPAAAIDFLVRFVTDKAGQAEKSGSVLPAPKKKKQTGGADKGILKRPIICICNDLYAPALRQLRQIGFVVTFPPISSARLADRLYAIAKVEGIKAELGTLLVLAEKTNCDVRSCISMMQFFGATRKPMTLHDVLKSTIGQKDQNKGLFQIWSSIFQIQRPRRILTSDVEENKDNNLASGGGDMVAMSDMSLATRMSNVLQVVQSNGDYERLTQGVYENFLTQKFSDNTMQGTAESIDWFSYSDRIQRMIHQLQNYQIYPYLPFGFVIWHFNFGSLSWPQLHFPSKGFEVHQKSQTHKMIFGALRHGMSPALKGIGQGDVILMDTVPLIRRILCPHIRSVSEHLMSRSEKSDLEHTVTVMADLGLNYSQVQLNEGKFKYQLEPDLEHISTFPDVARESLNYWTCQLVSREVQEEYIRRATPKMGQVNEGRKEIQMETETTKEVADSETIEIEFEKPAEPSTNVLRSNKDFANVKEVVVKDFFGRTSIRMEPLSVHEGGTDTVVKSPIWFRFKEGFNNAVRRDITIADLL